MKIATLKQDIIKKLRTFCERHDLEKGGLFDVRIGAINLWSRPWNKADDRKASQLIGTILIDRAKGEIIIQEPSSSYEDFVETYKAWQRIARHLRDGKEYRQDSIEEVELEFKYQEDLHMKTCKTCMQKARFDPRKDKYFCFECGDHVEVH